MKTCAFLSMESLDGFFSYDEMLFDPLRRQGWEVELVPWRRQGEDWSRFDAVVIRTPWDYYKAQEEFVSVLSTIDRVTRLENPLDIVIWNLDKRYLLDLEARGVPIVPTLLLEGSAPDTIVDEARGLHAEEFIVKPVVSANAEDTTRATVDQLLEQGFDATRSEAWLLQPFIDSVLDQGEVSLFYFAGEYSHAITKRPARDDFRVQEEHGGSLESITPDATLLRAGNDAMRAIGRTLLYGRVDLVRHEGRWLLMELELIEPSLYFNMDPDSPDRFVRAFADWFDNRRS